MIPHGSHNLASLFSKLGLVCIVCASAFFACDKLPLLAPTESTITLSASNLILPINGRAVKKRVQVIIVGRP